MSLTQSIRIARSALQAQRLRLDVAANNLANVNSTRSADGGPYRRQSVLLRADGSATSFAALLAGRSPAGGGVMVEAVISDPSPPRRVYEPSNPDADAEGFILVPNIDVAMEMTDLIGAGRSYQAGVTVLNAIKTMTQKALEIGR